MGGHAEISISRLRAEGGRGDERYAFCLFGSKKVSRRCKDVPSESTKDWSKWMHGHERSLEFSSDVLGIASPVY